MFAAGLRSLDIPIFDGSMFRLVIMYSTRDLVINFVYFKKAWSDIYISCAL